MWQTCSWDPLDEQFRVTRMRNLEVCSLNSLPVHDRWICSGILSSKTVTHLFGTTADFTSEKNTDNKKRNDKPTKRCGKQALMVDWLVGGYVHKNVPHSGGVCNQVAGKAKDIGSRAMQSCLHKNTFECDVTTLDDLISLLDTVETKEKLYLHWLVIR